LAIITNIEASQDKSTSNVNATGTIEHIITDEERKTFKLNDEELREAWNKFYLRKPEYAFLHDPTPGPGWVNLYDTWHWPQVSMVLVPKSAEILSITSVPKVLNNVEFNNATSRKATYHADLSIEEEETVSTTWVKGGVFSIGQEFTYGIKFLGAGGQGTTKLSYDSSWGKETTKSTTVTVGTSAGVEIELEPNTAVVAELISSQDEMVVKIGYQAHLVGNTVAGYKQKYKEHNVWSSSIASIMAAAGISNEINSHQTITIKYYTNSKIVVKDKETGALMATHILAISPGT